VCCILPTPTFFFLFFRLKEVNHMIQKAAKLRVGPSKPQIVAACRAAIKANNIQTLFKVIKTGSVNG